MKTIDDLSEEEKEEYLNDYTSATVEHFLMRKKMYEDFKKYSKEYNYENKDYYPLLGPGQIFWYPKDYHRPTWVIKKIDDEDDLYGK